MSQSNTKLEIVSVAISKLKPSEYNPRKMSEDQEEKITESIKRFGLVDPIIVNQYSGREDIIIGGHQRYKIAKKLGYKEMPVVYVNLNPEKEKELNIRLNKNQGEFDYELLKEFDKSFLGDIGFSSEELDDIFSMEDEPEIFDLQKELEKININTIEVQKGDIYELNGSRLLCGDSTIEADVLKLMGDEKAVLCLTDPPYLLSYLHGKTRHGEATTGFGAKKNRRYLETESLPDNFTELWMANVAKVQAENFAIIVYENWKNIRIILGEFD